MCIPRISEIAVVFAVLLSAASPLRAQAVPIVAMPHIQFVDSNGRPLVGGKLYTYAAGTFAPLATYNKAVGRLRNPNPVVLDSGGFGDIAIRNAAYKFVLKNRAGVTVWTVDNIREFNQLLQANLAAASREVITASDRESLAMGVSALSSGGTLIVPPGRYTVATTITISNPNLRIQCQPGAVILAGANSNLFTVKARNIQIRGCTLDGQRTEQGYLSNGIALNGAADVVIADSLITNFGGNGISITNSANIAISGNRFTLCHSDPISAFDNVDGFTTHNNFYDATGAAATTHVIGVHALTDGTTVSNINIHDETILGGADYPNVEIGEFTAGSVTRSIPTNVTIAHIKCKLTQQAFGCVSLAIVDNAVIEDVEQDANGFPYYASVELVIVNNVEASHVIEKNAATGQKQGIVINSSSQINLHDFNIQGQLLIVAAVRNPVRALTLSHIVIHDGLITTQTAVAPRGPVWIQLNQPTAVIQDVEIHHIRITGVDTNGGDRVTGPFCFAVENDLPPPALIDSVRIHHNSCFNVPYAFENYTSNPQVTRVTLDRNILGSRVTEFGVNGLGTRTTNSVRQ
jgi:hypothetical protein